MVFCRLLEASSDALMKIPLTSGERRINLLRSELVVSRGASNEQPASSFNFGCLGISDESAMEKARVNVI